MPAGPVALQPGVKAAPQRAEHPAKNHRPRTSEEKKDEMKVWIDQDLCTGDGLCLDHCPDVFVQLEDGIAYVRQGEWVGNDPGSGGSLAAVDIRNERSVVHAALDCPGECIFIELD